MHKLAVFAALVAIIAPAAAQDGPTKVKTQRIAPTSERPMYKIDNDGTVRIDWRRVEIVARSADLNDGDIARVLIAVRNGTAQPIP